MSAHPSTRGAHYTQAGPTLLPTRSAEAARGGRRPAPPSAGEAAPAPWPTPAGGRHLLTSHRRRPTRTAAALEAALEAASGAELAEVLERRHLRACAVQT